MMKAVIRTKISPKRFETILNFFRFANQGDHMRRFSPLIVALVLMMILTNACSKETHIIEKEVNPLKPDNLLDLCFRMKIFYLCMNFLSQAM